MTKNTQYADLVRHLEDTLFDIASEWRSTHDEQAVQHYHAVLNCMLELGWEEPIDLDATLPDRLMPEQYLKRWRQPSP